MRALVLLLFFFSGAAGLVYEVTWARSLGLVFGASHLAVATVLGVYMGGQALGAAVFGPRVDRTRRPLRLFGLLELGVAASAVAFLGMMRLYPAVYGPLARLGEDSGVYLTVLRTVFAVAALLVPTTLMGGTLPALVRFVARTEGEASRQLSSLYAFNTFGAVTGVLAAAFVLLAALGVTSTLLVAAATSSAVGVAAILLDRRAAAALASPTSTPRRAPTPDAPSPDGGDALVRRLTLVGIGVSGFCALGYEVLWTRMLTLVVGTSVHSFAIMLVAFLAGIGIGSHAFSVLARRGGRGARAAAVTFAGTQVAIGAAALGVTVLMRDLPATAQRVQSLLAGVGETEFGARLIASGGVAFAYMFVPAFFMGFAFPAAAAVWAAGRADQGSAVGRVLSVNTVGAILGAVVSGFVLVYAFGIERSLHMLVVVNVAAGLSVAAAVMLPGRAVAAIPALAVLVLVARGAFPAWGRVWDQKYFATYTNNTRSLESPERIREQLRDVDVLYYHEGVNETVSVIRPKGSIQTFIVNGRPEASTALMDVQLQRTLGHLPMLLHPDPRRVFVLGVGTGMTLGSASIHPEVERLVLGEIEEGMLGVARTFAGWNSRVVDNPRLQVVLNDGRNFLATTREQFDVISADPIHPWSGGAGYLYTREYFRSVSDRLAPGGIAAQWLPLYELSVHDVKTVVRTFADSFEHVMVWLTYYDAVLVGSNAPLVIDEAALARRMAVPAIRDDLSPVQMGTPEDLLSFFLMGTSGARAFGRGGALNTDDNLVLEFSAPRWQGVGGLDATNVLALGDARESLAPYVVRFPGGEGGTDARWTRELDLGRRFDRVHARFLVDRSSPEIRGILAALRARDPGYAPLRFLLGELEFWDRTEPALVEEAVFERGTVDPSAGPLRIAAVRQFVGRDRVLVSFVDPARREIYGQRYLDGEYERLEQDVKEFVASTLAGFRAAAERAPPPAATGIAREDTAAVLREEAIRLVGRPLAAAR
jgi:spermidine synthase